VNYEVKPGGCEPAGPSDARTLWRTGCLFNAETGGHGREPTSRGRYVGQAAGATKGKGGVGSRFARLALLVPRAAPFGRRHDATPSRCYPRTSKLRNEPKCNVEEIVFMWHGENRLGRLQKNDNWVRFSGEVLGSGGCRSLSGETDRENSYRRRWKILLANRNDLRLISRS